MDASTENSFKQSTAAGANGCRIHWWSWFRGQSIEDKVTPRSLQGHSNS